MDLVKKAHVNIGGYLFLDLLLFLSFDLCVVLDHLGNFGVLDLLGGLSNLDLPLLQIAVRVLSDDAEYIDIHQGLNKLGKLSFAQSFIKLLLP